MPRPLYSVGRYLGGKIRLAREILPWLQQPCDLYVEPMQGLFTLGLNLYHAPRRVGCELNPRTHNLLVQIRDLPGELVAAINGSCRDASDLELCWEPAEDSLEDARRYYWVAQSTYNGAGTRWSGGVTRQRLERCRRHQADHLWGVSDRLSGVRLLHVDGLDMAQELDSPNTLHYFDPTYENSVRGGKDKRHVNQTASLTRNQYAVETDQDRLLATVGNLRGAVVLSGYANPRYKSALEGWKTITIQTWDVDRKPRTECLWLNPQAWTRLPYTQLELIPC